MSQCCRNCRWSVPVTDPRFKPAPVDGLVHCAWGLWNLPECLRAHVPVILPMQPTQGYDCPKWGEHFLGHPAMPRVG